MKSQFKFYSKIILIAFLFLINFSVTAQTFQQAVTDFDSNPVSGGLTQSSTTWGTMVGCGSNATITTSFTSACNGHVNTISNNFAWVNPASSAEACGGNYYHAFTPILTINYAGLIVGRCYSFSYMYISTYCNGNPANTVDLGAQMHSSSGTVLGSNVQTGNPPQQQLQVRTFNFTATTTTGYINFYMTTDGSQGGNDFGIDNITLTSTYYGSAAIAPSGVFCRKANATITGMTNNGGSQQWQYSDNGSTWNNITANANNINVTTTTLGLVNYTLPAGQSQRYFRLAMTTQCGTIIYSNIDTITINTPNAGIDKSLAPCTTTATLAATGTGTWSLGAGSAGTATITTPSSPTTTVTNLNTVGSYKFIWTVSSGCTDTVLVTTKTCPLPITLTSFTASPSIDGNALLRWQTAMEQNSKTYEIEYSTDGINFRSVASVTSSNSATGASYSYSFPNLAKGQNLFKLKAIDFDGSFTYSKTVLLIYNNEKKNALYAAPNPASDNVNITGIQKLSEIVLYDMAGRRVQQLQSNLYTTPVDISRLPKGIYTVRITDQSGSSSTSLKVVKE